MTLHKDDNRNTASSSTPAPAAVPAAPAPQAPATPITQQPQPQPEVTMSQNPLTAPATPQQQAHQVQQIQQQQQQQFGQQPQQQPQPQAQPQPQPQVLYTASGQPVYQTQGYNVQTDPGIPYGTNAAQIQYGATPTTSSYGIPTRSYAGKNVSQFQLMSRPSSSISLKALEAGVKKCLENMAYTSEAKSLYGLPMVFSIDQSISKIAGDMLALVIRPTSPDGKQEVYILLLVLDARQHPMTGILTDGLLPQQQQQMLSNYQFMQTQPRVQLVPSDLVNAGTKDNVRSYILSKLSISQVDNKGQPVQNLANIIGTVTIPKGFGVGDPTDNPIQNAIDLLVFQSATALTTYFDIMHPRPGTGVSLYPQNLANPIPPRTIVQPGYILDANFTFNEATVMDVLGHPIRSDITINVSLKPCNSPLNGSPIATVHGYMDMVYADRQSGMGHNGFSQSMMGVPNPFLTRYYPVFVITAIRSQQTILDIGDILTTIAAVTTLTQNGSTLWMNGFNTLREGDRAKSRDIRGVLNEVSLVAGQGAPGKTSKSADVSTADIIVDTFMNNLFIAMDIEESGITSWVDNLLLLGQSPMQGDKVNPYYNALMRAANELTNDHFTPLMQGMPMLAGNPVRIHLGEYSLGKNVRDIRDLDTLSLLNECNPDECTLVRNWVDSMTCYASSPAAYLSKREEIIGQMLTSASINRYAKRVVFSGHFINSLARAINNSGVLIQASGVGIQDTLGHGQSPYNVQFALNNPMMQQMYGMQPTMGAYQPQMGMFGQQPFQSPYQATYVQPQYQQPFQPQYAQAAQPYAMNTAFQQPYQQPYAQQPYQQSAVMSTLPMGQNMMQPQQPAMAQPAMAQPQYAPAAPAQAATGIWPKI